MMNIKHIKPKLETAQHPVAECIHKGLDFKVLVIGFKKGMILKAHKTQMDAKLTVLEGAVNYVENDQIRSLAQYDQLDIPVGILHSVEATQDSMCLLSQGKY